MRTRAVAVLLCWSVAASAGDRHAGSGPALSKAAVSTPKPHASSVVQPTSPHARGRVRTTRPLHYAAYYDGSGLDYGEEPGAESADVQSAPSAQTAPSAPDEEVPARGYSEAPRAATSGPPAMPPASVPGPPPPLAPPPPAAGPRGAADLREEAPGEDVYHWVDAEGVDNYSTSVPPDARARAKKVEARLSGVVWVNGP